MMAVDVTRYFAPQRLTMPISLIRVAMVPKAQHVATTLATAANESGASSAVG